MLNFINKFILASTLLGLSYSLFASTKLKLDFELTYQTIDSFGASDAWTINPMITKWLAQGQQTDVEKLAELLFSQQSGIGLSAWRFNIGAGSSEQENNSAIALDNLGKSYRRAELMQPEVDGTIDESKQLGQIRFLQQAYHHGVSDFVAFVNSPPVWATKNGLAHPNYGVGVGSSNLDPTKLDAFTDFLVNVLTYLRSDAVGVPVNYISPVNEPTWEWQGKSQEGNRYNMEDLVGVYNNLYENLLEADLVHEVEIDAGEVVEYTAALSDESYRDFSGSSRYSGGMNGQGQGLYLSLIHI